MNDKKIAFIYCVNNRELYEESVRYVRSLYVPEGYKIEIITIEGAKSITSGYNEAMKKTDAKYKVYLHQDAFIVNKNFLYDIIALFEKYPKLGMIGVVGAKTIPRNGIWWESTQRFGKVYDSHTGEMKLLSFKETELEYEPVQAIDGLIMITQYDIPWREDLFTGWHFYDLSECQEFLLAGYDVGVVRQNVPWCVHDCGIASAENGFDNDRKKFVDVYGENVQRLNKTFLPLVSILIPTYNRLHYFELALQSALNQTYENIEVIVCDDSMNDEIERLISKYTCKYDNLTYIKNPVRLGQFENDVKLFNLARGEYINYLMDDDLFHPQKIEKMMNYYLHDKNNEIKLVTSHRQLIDRNGNFLKDIVSTRRLFESDTIIDGKMMADYVLMSLINYIGEPTTVLFRKSDLDEPFGTFLGRKYLCNVDLASWFNLLAKGKVVYISETLSYFRIHDDQQSQSIEMQLNGIIDFAHSIIEARKKGFLQSDRNYELALKHWLDYINRFIDEILNNSEITEIFNSNISDRIGEIQKYKLLMETEYHKLVQQLKRTKYDFNIDINAENNSHAMILRMVGKNKKVLELGCATGYMTNILTNLLGCEVSCVEYDAVAAEKARRYSNNVIVGDLNNFDFSQHFQKGEFDVIIFADVLEHLYDPLDVLKRVKPYLSANGEILVSIPNIAHCSVIAELLQGRFPYKELGLLDNTHIRFFTRSGVIKLFQDAGLTIKEMNRTVCPPEQTEFRTNLNVFPQQVADYLRSLPHADTYQFIVRAGLVN
ncbi:glycosyltransferase [Geobacillus stearothermophilus]|nr:glycosyltransferase [Geobacillus stearothermophilus]